MRTIRIITAALLVIGGLNWGLIGLFQFDLVAALFGPNTAFSRFIYGLVGLSALYQLFRYPWSRQQQLIDERSESLKRVA